MSTKWNRAIKKVRENRKGQPASKSELNGGLDCAADRATIDKALKMGVEYWGFDGAHHKDWVIDQMIRILAGDGYDKLVAESCDGDDGPNTYIWDCGIAP